MFHKTTLGGGVSKHIVDIANLEKVGPEMIENKLMWTGNLFDDQMVFRCNLSEELFVFDKQGIWNEDTLKHKLLY